MMKNKKMNTYLKFGLLILAFAVIGGILGALFAFKEVSLLSLTSLILPLKDFLLKYLLFEFILLLVLEIILGESAIQKCKKISVQIEDCEDSTADKLDFEMEKTVALATGILTIISILSLILLSFGYSLDYIKEMVAENTFATISYLVSCLLFILIYTYYGFWSVRLVKLQQKIDPTKKGDPTSTKFTEQWMESCDEAEQKMIYRASFKSYVLLCKCIPFLLVFSMVLHLIWNTGIMAVITVGIIWMIQNLSYLKACVEYKESFLN